MNGDEQWHRVQHGDVVKAAVAGLRAARLKISKYLPSVNGETIRRYTSEG